MKKNKRTILWIFILSGIILAYFAYPYLQLFLQKTAKTSNTEEVIIYVRSGTTLDELENQLSESKILDDNNPFREIANYKKLNDTNIAGGKYVIKRNYKISHLVNGFKINALGNGNGEVEVAVAFNNCRDVQEMAGAVSKFIEIDSANLVAYLEVEDIFAKYGFNKATFSSMFIANTYNMFWDTDAEEFVKLMADEFKRFWTPERNSKATDMGLSQSKVVTLASIVYAEQSIAKDEWPRITGLYINRLQTGQKLQSDPTFKFCWGRDLINQQRLYNKHREIDCAYNTYMYYGLPPGPINIPPSGVIDAVLNYEKNDYIFMCAQANNSGKHNFAVTYAEHQKNAAAFQKWMDANNIR